MLVTVTPYLRLHRDEVICVRARGNSVALRFVSMKPMRLPIDDLTDEAREWLLPSIAPRAIPIDEPPFAPEQDEESEQEARQGN